MLQGTPIQDTADLRQNPSTPCAHRDVCAQMSVSPRAEVLADIYRDEVNLAVWERRLHPQLASAVRDTVGTMEPARVSLAVSPAGARPGVSRALGVDADHPLCDDIVDLVEMFSELFGCSRAGLRLAMLELPMCPRFHVDQLGCRLVTTYTGAATEWLPHTCVDRARLGAASSEIADRESGLYASEQHIQRLQPGDVALLKGEGWEGNEGRGIVHRSPAVPAGAKRLMLTLDVL